MYHGHGFRCSLKHDDGASLTVPTAVEKEWQASNSEVSSGTKESVGRELPIVLRPAWTGVQRAFAVGKLVVRLQSSSWPAFLAEALLILLGLSGCMQVRFPGRAWFSREPCRWTTSRSSRSPRAFWNFSLPEYMSASAQAVQSSGVKCQSSQACYERLDAHFCMFAFVVIPKMM